MCQFHRMRYTVYHILLQFGNRKKSLNRKMSNFSTKKIHLFRTNFSIMYLFKRWIQNWFTVNFSLLISGTHQISYKLWASNMFIWCVFGKPLCLISVSDLCYLSKLCKNSLCTNRTIHTRYTRTRWYAFISMHFHAIFSNFTKFSMMRRNELVAFGEMFSF